ncbi:hypothetical protein MMC11_001053 [Xylographa trunciseda]|nr:hypothetical protein [Xylographa trunciseda]
MSLDGNRPQRRLQSASQYDQRFHGNHASYNDADYAHRPSDTRNGASSLVHRPLRESPKTQAHGPMLPKKDFAHAVSDLFEQLEKASTFYSATKEDFEADIKRVRDYAKPLMGDIWERKVVFMENNIDHLSLENPKESSPPVTFTSTYQHLRDSLEIAVRATLPREPRKLDEEEEATSWKQILLKVERERHDILVFAGNARKKFGQLGPLITELNLLITYLSNNKATWDREGSKDYTEVSTQEDLAAEYTDGVELVPEQSTE